MATPTRTKSPVRKTADKSVAPAKKNAAPAKKSAAPKPAPAAKVPARREARKVSPLRGTSIDNYIAGLSGWQGEVVGSLCALIRAAVPECTGSIKWGQPVFESNGPMLFIKPATKHVTLGFWRGAELAAPDILCEGSGERMRHVKLTSAADIQPKVLGALVRKAAALNRTKGDPSRRG